MTLQYKDANGVTRSLKTTEVSDEHVAHHIIQGSTQLDTIASNITNSNTRLDSLLGQRFTEVAVGAYPGDSQWWSSWIDCRGHDFLLMEASWAAVPSTAGALGIEGALKSDAVAPKIYDITSLITAYYGTWPSVAATAGAAVVPVKGPFPYMRFKYSPTGGGGPLQFTLLAFLRKGG